jgi:uncharacterized protein (DUF362 family)
MLVQSEMARALGHLRPRHVVIKPNWVLHETDPRYPIRALVTDARVITATVEAAAELFPSAQITVGDCPLQRADWPLLCEQSGLAPTIAEMERRYGGRVSFRDLRKDVYAYQGGRLIHRSGGGHGDPLGYRELRLGSSSHLEEISDHADRFAIHDHDRAKTRGNHQRGDHRYFVSQSFLDADLLINLPKWKTHSKSGLTGALKNLVGINGDKAYLPHFSRGAPSWGGDEYWDRGRWMYWTQNTLRDLLRTRWWLAYRAARPLWLAFKAVRRSMLRDDEGPPPDFYVGGGSWHGNQTIWRMIYDLNLVMQCVDAEGVRHAESQRHYFCIVDGLVCGEGDGPLFPQPREMGWLTFGADPFAVDATLAWFMGFDVSRLPIVAKRSRYLGPHWGDFELEHLLVAMDGVTAPLTSFPVRHRFVPPPGWIGHVENQGVDTIATRIAACS